MEASLLLSQLIALQKLHSKQYYTIGQGTHLAGKGGRLDRNWADTGPEVGVTRLEYSPFGLVNFLRATLL